ncbi:MAG: SpoIIIAH-like family protein, partial [Melioribacter sp.]|nr:SpoIIIAH-like family protein [Melioribacter sp.]
MTLVRFEPLKELETLHDRIQRYFEDFANFGFSFTDNFNPRIDISEDDNNINVVAEIPGVKKEDLKITLQDNILTIEGEKKKERQPNPVNATKEASNYFAQAKIDKEMTRSKGTDSLKSITEDMNASKEARDKAYDQMR